MRHAADPGHQLATVEIRRAELHVVLMLGRQVRIVDDEPVVRLDVVEARKELADRHEAGVNRHRRIDTPTTAISPSAA